MECFLQLPAHLISDMRIVRESIAGVERRLHLFRRHERMRSSCCSERYKPPLQRGVVDQPRRRVSS